MADETNQQTAGDAGSAQSTQQTTRADSASQGSAQSATGVSANQSQGQQSQQGAAGDSADSFDGWIAQQPEAIRTLYTQHTAGLQSALRSERDTRKELERKIKELTPLLEQGSSARNQLEAMTGDLSRAQQQVAFYESAPAGLKNPRLAYIAARESNLIADDGAVDWVKMRESYAELFTTKPAPKGNVGEGVIGGAVPDTKSDMNSRIRRAAGRS